MGFEMDEGIFLLCIENRDCEDLERRVGLGTSVSNQITWFFGRGRERQGSGVGRLESEGKDR
jgi:hypothetical protein